MQKPLILIANDDGAYSKGLATVINMLRPYGDLFVCVPEQGQSGQSQAITFTRPLQVKKIKDEPGLKFYVTDGTPTDSVKLAFNKLLDRKPDFLVSGINHGSNSSISAYYSGTVGAVIEGCFHEIPSIAFSLLTHLEDADFAAAEKYARQVFEWVLSLKDKSDVCLNVNIPYLPENEIKGIKLCRQTIGKWQEEFLEQEIDGEIRYLMTGSFVNFEDEAEDTDEWALKNGYVAVVPLSRDLTNHDKLKKLKDVSIF